MANNTQTGVISGVHGKHIFITNDRFTTIYACREQLAFCDPHLGLKVQFSLNFLPDHPSPVANNVRKAA